MLRVEARTTLGDFALDIAIDAPPGRCLAIAGPSGAGKSTVLRIVAGLIRPEAGRVACGDEVWLDTQTDINLAPERRRCGYVFQDYALFDHLTAAQNVAYGLHETPRADRRGRALELLDRLGLSARADVRPPTLSGGERQRVAVARALARRPDVLLLDEPLSALDARNRASATRVLASILDDVGVPAVLVTHDFTEAATLGDEVAIVDGGRLVQRGTAAELAATPATAFVADFTGAVVLTGTARHPADGLTIVDLDGGGQLYSTDRVPAGSVAASVYPWEIALEPDGATPGGSARNRIPATVLSATAVGGRVRLGLAAVQPLTAEVSEAAVEDLDLQPGATVTATFKATATRLLAA